MANRRCLHALSRRAWAVFSSEACLPSLRTLLSPRIEPINPIAAHFGRSFTTRCSHWSHPRFFSSNGVKDDASEDDADDDDDDDDDDDEEDEEMDYSDGESVGNSSASSLKKEYTAEEAEAEAAEIGYKVVGPLERSDRVFKPYEPVFAVIQIGSHQFKVSNGDCIFAERLKFCDVNDKLILNKVLLLGSSTQTIIGRPIVPDAAVHAVVEEHALDAKVIIFKKKRRKNYRRTKGHRQELTKLRITDIQGIEKPEKIITVKPTVKPTKAAEKKPEKVPA